MGDRVICLKGSDKKREEPEDGWEVFFLTHITFEFHAEEIQVSDNSLVIESSAVR